MILRNKICLVVVGAIALSSCQKSNVSGMSDVQTVDYFSKNPAIAKAVYEKCNAFERKEFSKLSSSDQQSWRDTSDGINCKNAREATAWHIWNERQQQLRESDRKLFGEDAK